MLEKIIVPKTNTDELLKNKPSWKDFIPSMIYWPGIITQIILVFFYYNFYHFDIFSWIGWCFMVFFMVLSGLPKYAFKKYGEIEKGKSFIHTTRLVDKGIYSIIRHPYWLCWILLSISLTLISQYMIMIIITIVVLPIIYLETYSMDNGLIEKFGEDYKLYKKKVPRMNLILGIIMYILRKKKILVKQSIKENDF